MKTYIIGIDPGLSGAIAFYSPEELIVHATPVITTTFLKNGKKKNRNEMDLNKIREIITEYDSTDYSIKCAYLEHVAAMRGQGVTSMFRFGQNFGQWEGALAALGIRTEKVWPQTWKAYYKLIKQGKTASRDLAKELFPENQESFRLVKHDGLAEASLIAKYGFDKEGS